MQLIGVLKKFICARCGKLSKRHNNIFTGEGLCRNCESLIPKEIQEARELYDEKLPIPDRLMYLYTSKQLVLGG